MANGNGQQPPDEVLDEVAAVPISKTEPPDEELDEVPAVKKKGKSDLPTTSVSSEPGKPSAESGKKPMSFVETLTHAFDELVQAYKTPASAPEPVKDGEPAKPTPKKIDFLTNAWERGTALAKSADVMGPMEGKPTPEQIQQVAEAQKQSKALPSSESYQKVTEAPSFGAAVKEFAKDPIMVLAEVTAESMSSMAQYGASRIATGAAIGAAGGTVVAPGPGTLAGLGGGAIVGMGETSLGLEFAGSVLESFEAAGVDVTDPKQLTAAFEDEAIVSKARAHAFKKSIPIALFDLVSGGIAGKLVAKPAKSLVGKTAQGAYELLVQAGLGAGGEATGQAVAGEKFSPGGILMEALGEGVSTPVEATTGVLTHNKPEQIATPPGVLPFKSPEEVVTQQTQNVPTTNEPVVAQKSDAIQAAVDQNEAAVSAGITDVKPVVTTPANVQEAAITPTQVTTQEPTVSETKEEEVVQEEAGTQEQVTEPKSKAYYQGIPKKSDFMQALLDENGDVVIQGSVNEVEEFKKKNGISDDIVNFVDLDLSNPNSLINKFLNPKKQAIPEAPQQLAPPQKAQIKVLTEEGGQKLYEIKQKLSTGDITREAARDEINQLVADGHVEYVSEAVQEPAPQKPAAKEALSTTPEFTVSKKPDDGLTGIEGVPLENQVKTNQGAFKPVHFLFDDEQAALFKQGVRPKKGDDAGNARAKEFVAKVREAAKKNRKYDAEIVLDFRKPQQNAIPEQSPTEVDVRQQTGDGGTLAEGNTGIQTTTGEGQPTVEGQPEATAPNVQPEAEIGATEVQRTPEPSEEKPATTEEAVTPPPPKKEKKEGPPKEDAQARKTWLAIKDDPNISKDIKDGISTEGKEYVPRSLNNVTKKEADAIVDAKGLEESTKMYLDDTSGMKPDVETAIGVSLFEKLQKANNFPDAIRVFEKLAKRGTELGQAVNAYKLLRGKTMLFVVEKALKTTRKKFKDMNETKGTKAKKAVDDINQKAVNQILKAESVEKAKKGRESSVKKAIDFLEQLKIDTKGKALDVSFGIAAATWNGVIATVQAGLKAGLTITQAINKAVAKVNDPNFKKKEAIEYLDEKLATYRVSLDPEKAIRAELKATGESIDNIIRSHFTEQASTKQNLVDKLIRDGNIPEDQAKEIADAIGAKFDELTRAAKEKALNKIIAPVSKKATPKQKKDLVDKLIEKSNLGALSEDQYLDAIANEVGVPGLTPEQAEHIQKLTEAIQTAKGDQARSKAAQDLYNYVENLKGWSWLDAVESIWFANILSGPTTWLVTNPFANATNLVTEAAIDITRNPSKAAFILGRIAEGLTRGLIQAKDVLKTGYDPFKGESYKIESKPLLERVEFKGGKVNPINWLKYVTRAIKAGDVLFFQGLKEHRLAVAALNEAKKNGHRKPDKNDMHSLYGQLMQQNHEAALQEAEAEGLKGSEAKARAYEIMEERLPEMAVKEAENFAARATFNMKPEGGLGAVADALNYIRRTIPIFKVVTPFVNTIINVANEYLNYNPVIGAWRAASGHMGVKFANGKSLGEIRQLSEEERARIAIKTVIGTVAMVALAGLDDEEDDSLIEITADGTGDIRKNYELQRQGWRSYSIRIGDTWFSYKNTPLAIPLATVGFWKDAGRYGANPDRVQKTQIAIMGSWKVFQDMSTLSGLADFFELMNKDSIADLEKGAKGLFKFMERTAKAVIVPNYFTQMSRLIQELADSPMKKAEDPGDTIMRDVPVLRDNLGNLYDVFGDPVVAKQLEKFLPFNAARQPEDVEMFKFLGDNKLFVGAPSKSNLKPNGTPMTAEEYDKFALRSAQNIKKRLMREYKIYKRMKNKADVQDWFDDVKSQERAQAKIDIFGYF